MARVLAISSHVVRGSVGLDATEPNGDRDTTATMTTGRCWGEETAVFGDELPRHDTSA